MSAPEPLFPNDEWTAEESAQVLLPAEEAEAWTAPEVEAPAGPLEADAVLDDPPSISVERLLLERPDVLRGFYEAFHGPGNDRGSTAWADRVGRESPEAYARYWYANHGKYEGYNQGPTTAQDNVSISRILEERPDVLRGFYEAYYGPNNDLKSDAWAKRVGGDTPEAYAKYWYENHGRWEGYAQSEKAAAEAVNIQRLLIERPDVLRAFYEEYYGPNNDRKSNAWAERVGDATPEAYAKYWYKTYAWLEGYHQRPSEEAVPPEPDPLEPEPEELLADLPDDPDLVVLEPEAGPESVVEVVGGAWSGDPLEWGG